MVYILKTVDKINEIVGTVVAYFVLIPLFVLFYETIARYFFNSPTTWAHELSVNSTVIIFLLPAGYTLLRKAHVAIDILTLRLSVRQKAILELFTSLIMFTMVVAIIISGWEFGIASVRMREDSGIPLHWPIYPLKMLVPISAFLLLLQGLVHFICSLLTYIRGTIYEY